MYHTNSFLSVCSLSSLQSRVVLRTVLFACVLQVLLLAGSFLFVPATANAITLDNFEGVHQVSSPGGSNITNRSVISTAGAIGGTRAIDTTSTSGPNSLNVVAGTLSGPPNFFDHNQTGTTTGVTNIHWDGNTDAATVDFDGLGGIDFTEDAGTAFALGVFFFDFPSGNDLTITLRAYDASDATGDTYSEWELVLDRAYNDEVVLADFGTPTSSGPSGALDPTNVGALMLTINGDSAGIDVILSSIGTNGNCPLIPGVGGRVLDDCGECIPPNDPLYNQSCADCLGVPNGSTLPGDSCDTGEQGPCGPGIYDQLCDCQRVVDPSTEVCDGVDNNCNGEIDETFPLLGEVCGIDDPNCKVFGNYICDGNGGQKCDIDLDQAELEGCGIDIGCDGIPGSGTVPDKCGVCGGDGSTCADLPCESQDIFDTIASLDGGAKDQEKMIRSITKLVLRNTRKKRIRNRVKAIREEAFDRQIDNWVLSWTIPTIILECDSALTEDFCVEVSNQSKIDEYIVGSEGLRDLGYTSTRLHRKVTSNSRITKRWRKRVTRLHARNVNLALTVPATTSSCVAPSS